MKPPSAGRRLEYALVTPARNEEEFIGRTLECMAAQTRPPLRWVIVSDGSTDATDRTVEEYARLHPWIELLRVERRGRRDFAGKARAFDAGYERLRAVAYDVVGNLDADLSFDEEFFSFLLDKFGEMPDLGVAGALVLEGDDHYDYRFTSVEHVSGSCQLFRRECFEQIGGYLPLEGGGIDWIAETTARMKGWRTRTFVEKAYAHHRPTGKAGPGLWRVWFERGAKDYAMGNHPLWQVARCVYQSSSRPRVIRGLMLLSGYAYRSLQRAERPVSLELLRFHRAEQMRRLKRALLPLVGSVDGAPLSSDLALRESLGRLERWVEAHDYRGYEPFDGLSSYLRPLTFGHPLLERVLQQVGRQSPINLRPLLGIRPLESTKGRGYMAWGYLTLLKLEGKEKHRRRATACLEWLIRNKSPLHAEHSWGNHFDYASRGGRYAKHEPTIVWTALIGQAFLDGYETLGEERYLEVARSICDWILKLPRERSPSGTCLSYLATRQLSIHNSNLLGAALLARTAQYGGGAELLEVARSAVEYSCRRQLASGAWHYGEDPTFHWIDNFHTGYDLDAIRCYIESSGDRTFASELDRGLRYYRKTFFEPDGRPRYYSDRAYPIDIQCAAQGIETLAKFADHDSQALRDAAKVARWTIRNMQDPSGFFYYRRYPFVAARIPMLHWGQATMYRALALLLAKLEAAGREPE